MCSHWLGRCSFHWLYEQLTIFVRDDIFLRHLMWFHRATQRFALEIEQAAAKFSQLAQSLAILRV